MYIVKIFRQFNIEMKNELRKVMQTMRQRIGEALFLKKEIIVANVEKNLME